MANIRPVNDEKDETSVNIARLPLTVGALVGAAIFFIAVIAVVGPSAKDLQLVNAIYGFTVSIPTLLVAYTWSSLDRQARAPMLVFFLGAWATIFGASNAIQHFDVNAGTFFYFFCVLAVIIITLLPGAVSRRRTQEVR